MCQVYCCQKKLQFYRKYGAEEYYIYDPDRVRLAGYRRGADGRFEVIPDTSGHVSPRLGVRFDMGGPDLVIYRPDGQRFLTFAEVGELAEQAAAVGRRADAEKARADRLAAKLRALGVDPDAV